MAIWSPIAPLLSSGPPRGRFVIPTANPYAAPEWGLPAARPGKFFMAELDNLWRKDRPEAERIARAYVAMGYNSAPTGPVVEHGYHGHYPDTNWLDDPSGFADFLEWLVALGISPRLFLWPDVEPWFKGHEGGWDWDRITNDLKPIYSQYRIRRVVRETRNAWEQYASIANMRIGFELQVALFPEAENLYHNEPGHLGPGLSTEDEGDCHRSMFRAGMDGLAIQTVPPLAYGAYGALNDATPPRTSLGQHHYDIWDIAQRYWLTAQLGPAGERPARQWGDTEMRTRRGLRPSLVFEEGCAFSDYWDNFDAYADYTRAALSVEGVTRIYDGAPATAVHSH